MARKFLVTLILGLTVLVAMSFMGRDRNALQGIAASPDVGGKIAYARSGSIWLYQGGKAQQLTAGPKDPRDKHDVQPSLSPDGTQLVYVRLDEGYSDLYKLTLGASATPEALTDHRPQAETGGQGYASAALWSLFPAWSPNGQRIAFTSDVRTEYPGLFSMSADGGEARKLEYLDHSQQTVEHPAWSPDGRKIAVANYLTKGSIAQVWVLDTATDKWIELTDAKDGAYDPAWSPDGEWVAFTMREGTSNNIYVVPTDAQKWTADHPTPIKLTTDGASRSPAWSPDGAKLAYMGLTDGSFDIYAADVAHDQQGNPTLKNTQKLTDKAALDATSGLSWSK